MIDKHFDQKVSLENQHLVIQGIVTSEVEITLQLHSCLRGRIVVCMHKLEDRHDFESLLEQDEMSPHY